MTDTTIAGDFDASLADGSFTVTDPVGRAQRLPGLEGYRLMEILRDFGLPIEAACGGAAACGTCHVFIGHEWLARLPPPSSDELWQLDHLRHATPASRLACQVLWEEARLDGLTLAIAPRE